MNKVFLFAFLPVLVFFTGCETLYYGGNRYQQNNEAVRAEMARQQVARNAEIARAAAQSSEARLQQLDARITRLESSLTGRESNLSAEIVVLRNELTALRGELADEKAERAKLRDEIISSLSGDMAKLFERQQKKISAAAAVAAASASSQSGYEHKVQAGQTLSAIALAYKVPMEKIRKANNLKSDMIRVGQVLFIPD